VAGDSRRLPEALPCARHGAGLPLVVAEGDEELTLPALVVGTCREDVQGGFEVGGGRLVGELLCRVFSSLHRITQRLGVCAEGHRLEEVVGERAEVRLQMPALQGLNHLSNPQMQPRPLGRR